MIESIDHLEATCYSAGQIWCNKTIFLLFCRPPVASLGCSHAPRVPQVIISSHWLMFLLTEHLLNQQDFHNQQLSFLRLTCTAHLKTIPHEYCTGTDTFWDDVVEKGKRGPPPWYAGSVVRENATFNKDTLKRRTSAQIWLFYLFIFLWLAVFISQWLTADTEAEVWKSTQVHIHFYLWFISLPKPEQSHSLRQAINPGPTECLMMREKALFGRLSTKWFMFIVGLWCSWEHDPTLPNC